MTMENICRWYATGIINRRTFTYYWQQYIYNQLEDAR